HLLSATSPRPSPSLLFSLTPVLLHLYLFLSFLLLPPPPRSTLFPYTTLFRSAETRAGGLAPQGTLIWAQFPLPITEVADWLGLVDRKSTRLNSSHQIISYAVFCLKKKKIKEGRESEHVEVNGN